jgi:hypothetical protein
MYVQGVEMKNCKQLPIGQLTDKTSFHGSTTVGFTLSLSNNYENQKIILQPHPTPV